MSFFDTAFNMNGREALALMGAHGVGTYNPVVISDNAYNWLDRETQLKVMNNKYYKVMAERKSKVYDQCTGTMDNQEAPSKWIARTHVLNMALEVWCSIYISITLLSNCIIIKEFLSRNQILGPLLKGLVILDGI